MTAVVVVVVVVMIMVISVCFLSLDAQDLEKKRTKRMEKVNNELRGSHKSDDDICNTLRNCVAVLSTALENRT